METSLQLSQTPALPINAWKPFWEACMQWAEMINLDCICPELTATDCTCATGMLLGTKLQFWV
jgi:hypothetical protein